MTDPATSDSDKGKGSRLFDWKKSGRYAWKSSFPLAQVDRGSRATQPEPKPAPLPSPAAPKSSS